jgi:protein-L-isoaspartate(D-aspartate) O-methyltransferase
LVKRPMEKEFAAGFLCRAEFIDFRGARNRDISRRLSAALNRDGGTAVKSLRRDRHTKEETCWLHGKGWCLSRLVSPT